MHDTVTVTADAPGDVPAGSTFSISSPNASGDPEDVPIYEDVRIASATLDGRDVRSSFDPDGVSPSGQYTWLLGTPIKAGQELLVEVEVDVTTDAHDSIEWQAGAGCYSSSDRDSENSSVKAEAL